MAYETGELQPGGPVQMQEPALTDEIIAAHGFTSDEFAEVNNILGRAPTYTEMGIFSAMWNEHCSYKSSKKWLRTLPTDRPAGDLRPR